jgi:hypothetical protein
LGCQKCKTAQTENGHYIQQLDPPVYIPFNAEPKIALYDLSFANTFRNIGPEFKNQTVEWAQATSADWATEQTHTITIPPGNYNLSDLELQIARELLETNDGSATCIWGRMNAMAREIQAHHELSPSADGMTVAAGVANPNVPGQFSVLSFYIPGLLLHDGSTAVRVRQHSRYYSMRQALYGYKV